MNHATVTLPRGTPRRAAVLAVAAILLLPTLAPAQITAPPPPPRAATTSLNHAAIKGLTLKVLSISTSFVIFSLGIGSAAVGGAAAVVNEVGTYVVYVSNEYLWDRYYPNTNVKANNVTFRPGYSLTRNTAKYLTLKPMLVAVSYATVYGFTGSLAVTTATTAAAVVVLPLTYYVNNMLWDWYDWRSTTGGSSVPPVVGQPSGRISGANMP